MSSRLVNWTGRGVVSLAITERAEVAAPVSGVLIGSRRTTPVSLRLFRPGGTRIAVLAGAVPAQLIVLRAAAGGATVRVASPRPQAWGPILRHGRDVAVAPLGAGYPPPGQPYAPVLIVDDRPTETGGLGEIGPWQCRLDIRALRTPSDLIALTHADALLFGAVNTVIAEALGQLMGLNASLIGPLGSLGRGAIAAVRRGSIQYLNLDPTPAEAQLLAMASR